MIRAGREFRDVILAPELIRGELIKHHRIKYIIRSITISNSNKLKLILIEGLPCSGKSFLGNNLLKYANNNENVKFYEELDQNNPIRHFPFQDFNFNDKNIIAELKNHVISEWSKFIEFIKSDDFCYIIDGRYIHNALLPMYSFCAEDKDIYETFNEITELILKVNSKLIYLDFDSIQEFTEQYILHRGVDRANQDITLVESLPISKKNKYVGKDGWLAFWGNWLITIKKIVNNTKIDEIIINGNYKEWNNNFIKITRFLNL